MLNKASRQSTLAENESDFQDEPGTEDSGEDSGEYLEEYSDNDASDLELEGNDDFMLDDDEVDVTDEIIGSKGYKTY